MQQIKTYRGLDLLDKILEFIEMTPDTTLWSSEKLSSNLPRLIRFQQVNSLLTALFQRKESENLLENTVTLFERNKNLTIQSVLEGDFIRERNIEDYAELISFIKLTVSQRNDEPDDYRTIHIGQLTMPYQQLVKYRRKLRSLQTFNSGCLEASTITSYFPIHLTNSITMDLSDKYYDLDKALELFINPNNLQFTEDELKEKYNFPLDNLDDVDIDNW